MLVIPALLTLTLQATPGCAEVRAELARWIGEVNKPVELTAFPPDPQTNDDAFCPDFAKARDALRADAGQQIAVGQLGDRRAAVFLHGPGGSGRYWTVAVAVESKKGVIGACFATETLAWRNIHTWEDQFVWRPLVVSGRGGPRLLVWSSLLLDKELPSLNLLMVATAWRLEGTTLVFDPDATRAQLDRFAATYGTLASRKDNPAAELHQAAAEGYAAFTSGRNCPR